MKRDDLTGALTDIGYGLKPDYAWMGEKEPEHPVAGPSCWHAVSPVDFGPQQDYELYEIGDQTAIYAVSNAALQWCFKFLPEHLDRWRDKGFLVETSELPAITKRMAECRLMSEAEYDRAMAEQEQLRGQW